MNPDRPVRVKGHYFTNLLSPVSPVSPSPVMGDTGDMGDSGSVPGACINWLTPDTPHAMACTVNAAGEYLHTRSFPTWADAMAFADRLARFIRTSHQIAQEHQ